MLRKCLACGDIIASENWTKHITDAHNGRTKILYKNLEQDPVTLTKRASKVPRTE